MKESNTIKEKRRKKNLLEKEHYKKKGKRKVIRISSYISKLE
jgi:hypothetical protein